MFLILTNFQIQFIVIKMNLILQLNYENMLF